MKQIINKKLYEKLKETVRNKKTIYYEEAADICNLDLSDPNERHNILGGILGEISEYEHENKRPMLSAVVVLKNVKPRIPGGGFFVLASELGKKKAGQTNEEFFREELKRVYDYWEKH